MNDNNIQIIIKYDYILFLLVLYNRNIKKLITVSLVS